MVWVVLGGKLVHQHLELMEPPTEETVVWAVVEALVETGVVVMVDRVL
jgi:hypothetical protein